MSSWLDTKFLGSIAKNALAEAQKTLDKALDIKDDDEGDKFEDQSQAIVTPIRSNQDQAGSTRQAPNTLVKSFSSNLGVGGWGSFTGSFFEAAELGKEKETEQQKSEKLEKIIKQNSSDGGSRLVPSTSEPVSLQPSTSSLPKSAEASQEAAKQDNPPKQANLLEQLNPKTPGYLLEQHQSSSSLMKASCESEILELELNSKLENSRLEFDNSLADILVGLVSVYDDQANREQSKVDKSGIEEELGSSNRLDVKNVVEEHEADTTGTLAQGGLLPVFLSSVSSVSGLVSSMTDESEELNSSVSSCHTCVPGLSTLVSEQDDVASQVTLLEQSIVAGDDTIVAEECDFSHESAKDVELCDSERLLSEMNNCEMEASFTVCRDQSRNSTSPNLIRDFVISRSMIEDAMREKSSSSQNNLSTFENNQSQISPQGYDIFSDDKRPESEAGSHSSKSFELLKMPGNSGKTGNGSGHTSGDDLETFTTTSSDIEVISSPGFSEKSGAGTGGSPVNASRKGKGENIGNNKNFKKGHFRTCSEISSVSCQSESGDSGEADRLLKKIFELSEILEARETKMVELSRSNLELQEQNVDLASQVREAMKINSKMTEANISSEEFTQRMANLEKKLQQTTAERDSLKEENKDLKKDRLCLKEVSKLLAEKDEVITDLREEGESLSRQAGKHSEIIKKLRTKEKSLEKDLTSTKSSLEEKTKECDRLKKSLSAKDEMESKQIEAIRELSSANAKWEEANMKMASDLEDAHDKANGLRLSLETAYKEMGELKRGLMEKEDEAREAQLEKEVEAREKIEKQAREDLENFRLERDSLCREIDELRVALSAEERSGARREEQMRRERQELQQRLEQSEHRHEELSGSVSLATRPLLRQIESLQASLNETRSNSDRVEQSLTERLQQTSLQHAAAQERERTASDQYRQIEFAMYANLSTMAKPFGYKIRDALSESQCSRQCAFFFVLCLSYFVGTNGKNVGQIDGQPPIGGTKKKKIKSGGLAPKMGLGLVAMGYALFFTLLGIQSTVAFVKNFEKNQPHHVIFDDLGKMSTGVTYINIAIPLNISILYEQIEMFSNYLNQINSFNGSSTPYDVATEIYGFRLKEKDKISLATNHNMEQLTKQLAAYAKKRLTNLSFSLKSLDNLLPQDPTFELTNERHKRFVFMIPMIICEVNKNYWKDQHLGAVNKMSEIYHELNLYKQEYARLYNETLPELIPEYIEDNHDAMDEDTLETHVDYLTRTKRDVQFLINIIKLKDNSTFTPQPVLIQPTTPNPFRNFSNLYTNHKKQPLSSTFMKPGTSSQQHKEQLIKGRGTLQQPIKKKLTTQDRRAFSHSELIDLDIPYLIRNRTKRFLPAAALAAGALGTFLGIFNTVEINNLRRDMGTMSNNQNLLIQVNKIHTEQILQLEVGLMQLNQIFGLYLKNNPSLLYAKLEDVLQSLADRMGNLKDTLQMLQLQRLSTSTLSSFQLTNLYNEVKLTAKSNNLELLTNKPQDLFQLDTSYLRVNNEILVLVHVPCSNPSSLLTIYKYVPFPIPVLPNFNANTSVLNTIQDVFDISSPMADNALEGIHFQADADLIAIGKNDKGRHRYILLSSAEMSACIKRSNAFMCERHQVTKSDLLGSCLGSLYLQSPLGVATNCKINRIPLKETVYQISNTNHIVFTPYPITTQISCFNGSYFPLKIKHTQQVRIPEGCSVELTNHTITSDFSIRITSDSVHFEWDFDPISLPNSAQLMLDSKSIDSKLKFIEKLIEKVKMGDIHARGFENLMVDHVSSGSWLGTTFIVCFVITGILAILTAVICARNYLLARGWIGTRSGPPNHSNDFNVSYRRDRGIFDGEEEEQELSRIIRRPSGHRTGTHSTTASRETPPPFIHLVNPTAPEL